MVGVRCVGRCSTHRRG